jgi:UTP-glucose-1-phosphate uridylyltransferase
MPETLVILAAGMGSRYGGLKQLDPIGPGGETLMDYSVYDALRAGFSRLVFVIRRDMEAQFKSTIGQKFERLVQVQYAYQELENLPAGFSVPAGRAKPWGTGHAVLAAADVIHEPFAVINADDFYGPASFRALGAHLRSGAADYAMVGFVLRNTLSEFGTVARGVCQVDAQGFLQNVTEMTRIEKDGERAKYTDAAGQTHPLSGDEIVSLNMWGFLPSLFPRLKEEFSEFLRQHNSERKAEFYIPSAVNKMVETSQACVKVLRTPDYWFGITYRQDRDSVLAGLNQLIARGDYPAKLWA